MAPKKRFRMCLRKRPTVRSAGRSTGAATAAAAAEGASPSGLRLSRRERRALTGQMRRRATIRTETVFAHLPLQADNDGAPALFEHRSDALPGARCPFVCVPLFDSSAAAEEHLRDELVPGVARLVFELELSGARFVDATGVRPLDERGVRDADRTAHALLGDLARQTRADVVCIRGEAAPQVAVLYTRAIGSAVKVVSMDQVELDRARLRRNRVGRRVRECGLALALAFVASVVLLFAGVDHTVERLRTRVDVGRLLGTDVPIPVWVLGAVALLTAAVGVWRIDRRQAARSRVGLSRCVVARLPAALPPARRERLLPA
jgi:hypothetical protein